jgi:hypothetical protein
MIYNICKIAINNEAPIWQGLERMTTYAWVQHASLSANSYDVS